MSSETVKDYPIQPPSPYALEFHIPYFALRKSFSKSEKLHSNIVGRRSGVFADSFTRNCEPGQKEFFHEAQVSVLLVGIDEWVWTLYCLVEGQFEDSRDPAELEKFVTNMSDAPSGNYALYQMPIWNPREYFLMVLCRRMDQATLEWQNLVETLDQRLKDLVSLISLISSSRVLTYRRKMTPLSNPQRSPSPDTIRTYHASTTIPGQSKYYNFSQTH